MVALCVEKRGRPTALRLSRAADCCVEARFCAASKQDKQRSKKAELEISYLQRRIVGLGMCRCRDTAKGLWRYGFIYFRGRSRSAFVWPAKKFCGSKKVQSCHASVHVR